ncbi:MAG: putative metal-dependent hydrolase [Pyrinomonadaceae bacterium]|nr:putative metal-dependent hydrolase [Sphingobacteriaceae bacterium]
MEIEKLRYPIGIYKAPEMISDLQLSNWLNEIESLPAELQKATLNLTESDFDKTYRPGGWTIKQVIHHVADSHMNSYIRFKLAVTEENPTIRPYYEDRWAECEEARNADVSISLDILQALHKRWVMFLRLFNESDWQKTYYHPENKKTSTLKEVAGLYAWHGKHHLNHVLIALK